MNRDAVVVDPPGPYRGLDLHAVGAQRRGSDRGRLRLLDGEHRSAASTTVTRTPNRANTWASSSPIAPPPSTASVPARLELDRLVVGPVRGLGQPGHRRGRRTGPGADDHPLRAANSWSPTRTRPAPSRRPCRGRTGRPSPRTARPPPCRPSRRSPPSRIRVATGAQSGAPSRSRPALAPGAPRPAASAARIIILLGTQPQ